MRSRRRRVWPLLVALVAPTIALIAVRTLLMVEIVWLYIVYGVVFTLAALLLTWTFAYWNSE